MRFEMTTARPLDPPENAELGGVVVLISLDAPFPDQVKLVNELLKFAKSIDGPFINGIMAVTVECSNVASIPYIIDKVDRTLKKHRELAAKKAEKEE